MNLAFYNHYDTPSGHRIHHWMPKDQWAIGNGPIETITREQAIAIIKGADVRKTLAKEER